MRSRRARLWPQRLAGIVVRDFFLAQPASPRVVAGVDQDAVGPADKTRLATKAGDAPLHFQEGFLYRIFGIDGTAKNIPRQVLHARAMHRVESLVSAQITGPAGSGQYGVLAQAIHGAPAAPPPKIPGTFHPLPPFPRHA